MASGRLQVDVDVDVDGSDLIQHLEGISDGWPAHRDAALLGIGEHLVGGMKREVDSNTGRMSQTIRTVETGRSKAQVVAGGISGVDYVLPYLEGSKPHAPGPSNPAANPGLARWARRNNYPGGFDGIYWSIARYGTEEHDFVSEPLADTQAEAGNIATQILRNRGAFG